MQNPRTDTSRGGRVEYNDYCTTSIPLKRDNLPKRMHHKEGTRGHKSLPTAKSFKKEAVCKSLEASVRREGAREEIEHFLRLDNVTNGEEGGIRFPGALLRR